MTQTRAPTGLPSPYSSVDDSSSTFANRVRTQTSHLRLIQALTIRRRCLPTFGPSEIPPPYSSVDDSLSMFALRANGIKRWREVIDRYHLNERLACALAMVDPDPLSRRRIYAEWHKQLDTKQLAIHTIKSWLEKRCNKVAKGNRKEFRAHTTYLFLNERRLRYARMKREGLPIGSGVTEGTCKSLYAARVKRSGQRWYQDGLTGVLTLRALHLSERLPRFWRHFTPRFRRCVQAIA